MAKLVRIKPYNAKAGHKILSYTYAGVKYLENRGWYRLEDDSLADELAELKAGDGRYDPEVFDVMSEEEAVELEQEETFQKEKAKAAQANEVLAAKTIDKATTDKKSGSEPRRRGRARSTK